MDDHKKRGPVKNRFRFILVDDCPFTLALEEKLIQGIIPDAETIAFSSACEALNFILQEYHVKRNPISTVLLTDVHMPETDGLALLDAIEEMEDLTKGPWHVFVLSAAASPMEVQRALSHCFVKGFYTKPLCVETMEKIMNRIQYPD